MSLPLYEYKCLKCDRHTDKIEPVAGPHLKKCPHCGGKVESVITAPAIKFKGSGWYVNDYAAKTSSGESKKPDGSSSDTKDSKDSKESSSKDSSKDSAKNGGKESASKDKDSSSKGSATKETSSKESSSKDKKSSAKKD